MSQSKPQYYVRRVRLTHEEVHLIDAKGNTKAYVDPELPGRGEVIKRVLGVEKIETIEGPRILTEGEAMLMGVPYEGDIIRASVPEGNPDPYVPPFEPAKASNNG